MLLQYYKIDPQQVHNWVYYVYNFRQWCWGKRSENVLTNKIWHPFFCFNYLFYPVNIVHNENNRKEKIFIFHGFLIRKGQEKKWSKNYFFFIFGWCNLDINYKISEFHSNDAGFHKVKVETRMLLPLQTKMRTKIWAKIGHSLCSPADATRTSCPLQMRAAFAANKAQIKLIHLERRFRQLLFSRYTKGNTVHTMIYHLRVHFFLSLKFSFLFFSFTFLPRHCTMF